MERHPSSDLIGQPQPRWQSMLWGIPLHLLAALLAALLLATPMVADLEQGVGLHWLFHLRGARPAPQTVAVVAIDHEAAQRLGLPIKPGEWPRSMHARLVDALARAGVRTIAFDMTFATPSKQPSDDTQLAAAIRRAGNVVLVDSLRRESVPAGTASGREADTLPSDHPVPPIAEIAQSAIAHVPFPLPKAGRVDAFWTFMATSGDLPTLPVAAFQAYADKELGILLHRTGAAPDRAGPGGDSAAPAGAHDESLVGTMRRLRTMLADRPESSLHALYAASPSIDETRSGFLRTLVALYAGDDARYLDYYGPPRTITTLAYPDALDPAGAASLAGKVVFVGFSGASAPEQDRVRDHYPTVFSRDDGVDLSGVEIAATAFANLLERRAVHPLPLWLQFALVILFGSVLGTLICRLPQRFAYVALIMVGASYLAFAHRAFTSSALWLPLAIPLGLQLPLAALVGTWQRYRIEQRRVQIIRRVFARFLPPDVVEQLVGQFDSFGEIRRPIYGVCLSSDMEGFTRFAECLEPHAVTEHLNAYYARLFGPIEQHGGFVSDIVGDAMLAIWGSSANDPAVRRSACRAAIEIAGIESAETGDTSDDPALHTRLGLNAGEMELVAVGASRHFEFRAVGDTVNTASRIEGLSKHLGTRLLVTASVTSGLDEFLVRPVGTYVLAGKTAPVGVGELLGLRQAASAAALDLCSEFAHALQVYESGAWQAAATLFAGILRRAPGDGPSRFFVQLCAGHAADPTAHPWSAQIRMSEK